eukprot:sb/3472942/
MRGVVGGEADLLFLRVLYCCYFFKSARIRVFKFHLNITNGLQIFATEVRANRPTITAYVGRDSGKILLQRCHRVCHTVYYPTWCHGLHKCKGGLEHNNFCLGNPLLHVIGMGRGVRHLLFCPLLPTFAHMGKPKSQKTGILWAKWAKSRQNVGKNSKV